MTETASGPGGRKTRSDAPAGPAQGPDDRAGVHHAGVHPYDEVTWERRDVVQTNWKTGETIFEQKGVEFPDFWSLNASTIVTTKYFRGALGTDVREWSLKQLDRPGRADLHQGRQGPRLLRAPTATPRSSSTS